MNAAMLRDYTFYKVQFADAQALADSANACLGFSSPDLAWAKVVEREAQRHMITDFSAHNSRLRQRQALQEYAKAIGVQA